MVRSKFDQGTVRYGDKFGETAVNDKFDYTIKPREFWLKDKNLESKKHILDTEIFQLKKKYMEPD